MGQEQGNGKSMGQVKFDPTFWQPKMIDQFLEDMANNLYHVEARPRNAGVYVGWERGSALYPGFQKNREVTKGEGRGEAQARSS
eukprot:2177866-Pyramimonas_sp.AAC.1